MPSAWPTGAVVSGRKSQQWPEMTPAAIQLLELIAAEIAEELIAEIKNPTDAGKQFGGVIRSNEQCETYSTFHEKS